jgi:hypothetical protein
MLDLYLAASVTLLSYIPSMHLTYLGEVRLIKKIRKGIKFGRTSENSGSDGRKYEYATFLGYGAELSR